MASSIFALEHIHCCQKSDSCKSRTEWQTVDHDEVAYFELSHMDLHCTQKRLYKSAGLKALRKHAYSNILKIFPPKNEHFQIKILMFFIFLLKT